MAMLFESRDLDLSAKLIQYQRVVKNFPAAVVTLLRVLYYAEERFAPECGSGTLLKSQFKSRFICLHTIASLLWLV